MHSGDTANACNAHHLVAVVAGPQIETHFDTGGPGDGSQQGGGKSRHDHSQSESRHEPAQGRSTDSSTNGGSQRSADCESDAAMGGVLAAALTSQLRQPSIYKALGMTMAPTSIPVWEADRWLESWHVIASSVPSEQAKLSAPAL